MRVSFLKKMALGWMSTLLCFSFLFAQSVLPEKMILSNSPERITAPGTIFKQTLDAAPLRVMYHHKNDMAIPLFIRLSLYNPLPTAVSVKTLVALGGPDLDEVFAGHQSIRRYFDDFNKPRFTKNILPGETYVLVYHAIKADMVSTGLVGVSGNTAGLVLEMNVVDPTYEQLSALNEEEEKPYRILEAPQGRLQSSQTIDLSIPIDVFKVGEKGDYGVLYDAEFSLFNPTSTYKQVKVYFSPAGGIARGVMLWDGQLVETELIHPKGQEVTVKSVVVQPGETKRVRLLTMPQGGSFYPVDMVFQSKDHGMIGSASKAQEK